MTTMLIQPAEPTTVADVPRGKPITRFFVPGLPQPGGSKRGFVNPRTGRVVITENMPKNNKEWRAAVAHEGYNAFDGPLLAGPVVLCILFVIKRPKSHYGTGRNAGVLKASAPDVPTTRPDTLKLARSTEDALTGVIWHDDSINVTLHLGRRYGERPGAHIEVHHWS